MANITWRNVESRDSGAAVQALNSAAKLFDSGLGDFQKALQFRIDRDNGASQQAYMELLNNAKTPEEMAALQESGQLDQMRAGMDQTVAGRTLGAAQAHTNELFKVAAANQTRADEVLRRQQLPLTQQISALSMTDPVAARKMMEENKDLLSTVYGDLAKTVDANNTAFQLNKNKVSTNDVKLEGEKISLQKDKMLLNNATQAKRTADANFVMSKGSDAFISTLTDKYYQHRKTVDSVMQGLADSITGKKGTSIDSLTGEQNSQLIKMASAAGIDTGLTTNNAIESFREYARKSNLPMDQIESGIAKIEERMASLNSNLRGPEAETYKAGVKAIEAAHEKVKKENPFMKSPADNGQAEARQKVIETVNDKTFGSAFNFQQRDVREYLQGAMVDGVTLEIGGKKETFVLPPEIASNMLAAAKDNSKWNNLTNGNFGDFARQYLQQPDVAAKIAEATEYRNGKVDLQKQRLNLDTYKLTGQYPNGSALERAISNARTNEQKAAIAREQEASARQALINEAKRAEEVKKLPVNNGVNLLGVPLSLPKAPWD